MNRPLFTFLSFFLDWEYLEHLFSQSSGPTVIPENGLRVMQLMKNINGVQRYPDALPSLLKMMNEQTWAKFDTDPLFISELTDERLFENPILYINCDDQTNLEFTAEENQALRRYMELGRFCLFGCRNKSVFFGC